MRFWKWNKRQTSGIAALFIKLLVWSTFVWIILLSITVTATLRFSLDTLEKKIDQSLIATSSSLANSQMVHQALQDGYCSLELKNYLDNLISLTEDMDVITIADTSSIRLYHVVPQRIGQEFVGGDQGRALRGESYTSDAVGTLGLQHRAFAPVQEPDGTVLGFVMASTTMSQLNELRNNITATYSKIALLLMLATLVLSGMFSLFIRRLLHGFSPEELVHTYLTQNEVLNNLEEGVVSVDAYGKIQLVNHATEEMLGQSAELLEGTKLDDLIRCEDEKSLLLCTGQEVSTSRPNILSSCIPLKKDGKRTGTTFILKDKSETIRKAEQLAGTRHIISALRANSHEYMNMLQVISGLLQMGRTQDAMAYIGNISAVHANASGPVLQHIHNPNVAALLLGKLGNMRELDIHLTLLANSHLPVHSQYLSTTELVTVIGNLVENAIEAINATNGKESRSIVLQITENDEGLLIMVLDSGVGMPPEILPRIFDSSFSTKADEGRGVGMSLIRNIVTHRGGSIEIDSEPGSGTTFTLVFSEKRQERVMT
ncbi:MAG: sensor histidine kinase [Angelakisella sp.]|nr:sensor histidine kinase [Angelakisella sp.]